jgi:hypothetical protein
VGWLQCPHRCDAECQTSVFGIDGAKVAEHKARRIDHPHCGYKCPAFGDLEDQDARPLRVLVVLEAIAEVDSAEDVYDGAYLLLENTAAKSVGRSVKKRFPTLVDQYLFQQKKAGKDVWVCHDWVSGSQT